MCLGAASEGVSLLPLTTQLARSHVTVSDRIADTALGQASTTRTTCGGLLASAAMVTRQTLKFDYMIVNDLANEISRPLRKR
jgi:hypothetical protein